MPVNVASIGSITVEALNKLNGVTARGFFINKHKYHYVSKNSLYFSGVSRLRRPIKWLITELERYYLFRKLYREADVIHWIYDDIGLKKSELLYVRKTPKPSVIEWVGSEIRNPEFLSSVNPFYAKAFINGYEYAGYESSDRSRKNQEKFRKLGSIPIVTPEIDLYLIQGFFVKRFFIEHKIFLEDFLPVFPDLNKNRPLIVHSPTAKVGKGSDFIIRAVNELKDEFEFDFLLLHDMDRAEVLTLMRSCDIFIDQVITGMYGLASVEAMAFGKPVFCFLLDEVVQNGIGEDCPIVNVTVDSIKDELRKYLSDPILRNTTGKKSRRYAEMHFDAKKNAQKLVEVYADVIQNFQFRK